MRVIQANIPDIVIIKPNIYRDHRGYFMESFRSDLCKKHLGEINFVQDNESMSEYGVIRGLHYQLPPFGQNKLVRVVTGTVLDVALDIRVNSPFFGQHTSIELSGENMYQIYIPKGFAHGFAVLSKNAIITYKVDTPYAPEYERTIRFDDPRLNIKWQLKDDDIILSEKDKKAPFFHESDLFEEPV